MVLAPDVTFQNYQTAVCNQAASTPFKRIRIWLVGKKRQCMQIDVQCLDASDTKAAARAFVMNNYKAPSIGHMFRDAGGQVFDSEERRVICVEHAATCTVHESADILLVGLSCQPVSCTRRDRFTPGNLEAHPEFQSYQAVLEILKSRRLCCAAIEEVMGFTHRCAGVPDQNSPLEDFVESVQLIGLYNIRLITVDCTAFVKFKRKRLR